jgi:predicted acetyltransferase
MTFRDGSLMRQALYDLRSDLYGKMGENTMYPHKGVVFLLKINDELVGWALTHRQLCKITRKYETLGMLWVKTKHRRKGYGTELYNAMFYHHTTMSKFQVIPHDYTAKMFFRNFGITFKGVVPIERK